MEINFKWNDPKPKDVDLATIEENISNEIAHLLVSKPESSANLSVDLLADPLNCSLIGIVHTTSKRVAITFTYLLHDHHLATYQYHQ
jgi:hypothetical protein